MADKKANFFRFVPPNKKQRRFALLTMFKSNLCIYVPSPLLVSLSPHGFQTKSNPSGYHGMDSIHSQHFSHPPSEEHAAIAAAVDDLDVTLFLTQSRQVAIETLQDFEDRKILDLLSAVRLPSHVHHLSTETLSSDQIDALLCLQQCPDGHILLWLRESRAVAGNHSRGKDNNGPHTSQVEAIKGPKGTKRRPLRTKRQPSSAFPDPLPYFRGHTTRNMTRESLDRQRFLNHDQQPASTQETPSLRAATARPWQCINMFCQKHLDLFIYETCDGWKRHVKEHETIWPCMPYGPLEIGDNGLICVLCGSVNPSESHVADHSIGGCGDTTTKLRGISRRYNLEKHLRRFHAVTEDRVRSLANSWKTTARKKYFSCGFCVCIFSTIHEQLDHIDMEHFKKGQQVTEWSATNVIRGLLLSPSVASSFQERLFSDPYTYHRKLHWDAKMVERLQRRLEMAEATAEALAFEAYTMLSFNLSRQSTSGQQSLIDPLGLDFAGQCEVQPFSCGVSVQDLENNSEHQTEETSQVSGDIWCREEHCPASPVTRFPELNYQEPMNRGDTLEAQHSMTCQSWESVASRDIVYFSASSGPQYQAVHSPSYHPSQTRSTSNISEESSTSAYNSSGMNSQSQATWSTQSNTLHSTENADMLGEQPNTCEGPIHYVDAAGFPLTDHEHTSQSSSLDRAFDPLETCDPRDLIKRSH